MTQESLDTKKGVPDIVFLLDASGSMSEVWAPVCREACAIVDALPQGARLTVLAFSADTHALFSQCPLGSRADRAALKHQLTEYKPPFLGTHMGRALRYAVDALSDPAPRSPSLLPVSGTAAAPPMIFLATDGRSSDAINMADLLHRQPDLTVHVTAYTTDPDAAILAQLCSNTGGMYLFCPTADAAAHDQDLALQRAQQILSAAATPVLRTALTCTAGTGAGSGSSAVVDPQLMDMNRPLRPHPGAPLRLPFSVDQACTFTLTMQCLDGTLMHAEAVWDPARPPAFCVQAQRDVDAARLAEAAQLSESEHSDAPLRALLQSLRARQEAAEAEFALGQAMDRALGVALGVGYAQPQEKAQAQEQALSLARESVRKAEDLLARASMPAALPHLAAHLSSLSQGGNSAYGGGTSSSTVADEALQLATLLSQTLSQDPTSTLVYEEDTQATKRARREKI